MLRFRTLPKLQRGFTLLELLVALVVLGLLVAALSQGTQFGLRAWGVEQAMGSRVAGLETTDRALRLLLARASPGDPASRGNALIGNAREVSFVTTLPDGYGAPATHEADVTLLVDGRRLELRWRPHYRRWIAAPPAPAAISLVTGVDHIVIGYWTSGAQGQGWSSTWQGPDLPRLVRVQVVFPSGDSRQWPDIIVAPMRERPSP
jgi:general secretion pathway protein J